MKALLPALLLVPCLLRSEGDLVRWVPESQAVELARKSSKPILYDLTAAWCPPCRLQEKQVFNDPEHAAWINKSLIPVRVMDRMREDRSNSLRTQQLQQKYKLKGFPTLVVDMPSKSFFGNSKWKSKVGYNNPGDTMQFLRESIDALILGEPGGVKKTEPGFVGGQATAESPQTATHESPGAPAERDIFFGYGSVSKTSRWGTAWTAFSDDGRCGTKLKSPASGSDPVIKDTGTQAAYLHFAGHLGRGNGPQGGCPIVSWAALSADFAQGTKPVDLAAKGVSSRGLRLLLKLGPTHPIGRQNYVVILNRKSITPDIKKNLGSDYAFGIKAANLRTDGFVEVLAPFPPAGKAVREPSHFFAQPGWIVPSEVHPWGTNDLTIIGFTPMFRNSDFDLYVAGVAFY